MNELTIFNFENQQVRTIIQDSEPWFVAKDVCDVLGHTNSRVATERLDEDEKGVSKVYTPGGGQEMTIINESGLYALVLTSNIPKAKAFKRWITHEVIPQIRKSGVYVSPQVDSKMLYQIAQALEEKEKQIALMKPKAEFFDAVANSKDAIDLGTAAKVLNMGMGRTTLFRILREKKILNRENVPYQEYIDRGYFRTIEQKYTKPDGSTCINIKSLVYQKGLSYIRKILAERKAI